MTSWGEGTNVKPANRSGVVALREDGVITDATWTVGLDDTVTWIERNSGTDTLLFVDAPLLVDNDDGQRLAERQVGQRYGRWWVSANSTNRKSPRQAGVHLRERLEHEGRWTYDDGRTGPPTAGRRLSECYPYTTIVGVPELGYDKRPAYKRAPKKMPAAEAWPKRAEACDDLIERIAKLASHEVPMDLRSHDETRDLIDKKSPTTPTAYKEALIICLWV